ncbi:MAG: helix-turn-helix domain-containing protein [Bacteroidales bacterium]|nr:helix-turn-helix domain-containing protein [Bacteroidales bacterium]
MNTLEKLKQISEPAHSNWREKAQWRKDNRDWLRKSGRIAVAVLEAIDANPDMSQAKLAEKMGVTKQYISKIVKGQENLSLQTICKLESALGITLVEVQIPQASQMATPVEYCQHQWLTSKQILMEMTSAIAYSESYQVA